MKEDSLSQSAIIEKSHVLIVEGQDENQCFLALLKDKDVQLDNEIQILSIGGKTKIHTYLPALVITPGFKQVKAVGIIRDADTNFTTAFESVCSAVKKSGLPLPAAPQLFQSEANKPRVGIMILPGTNRTGALEDLILDSLEHDRFLSCVETFASCIKKQKVKGPKVLSKTKVRAYLAALPDSDVSLGIAAQKGRINWEHTAFDELKHFLKELVC